MGKVTLVSDLPQAIVVLAAPRSTGSIKSGNPQARFLPGALMPSRSRRCPSQRSEIGRDVAPLRVRCHWLDRGALPVAEPDGEELTHVDYRCVNHVAFP